MAILNGYNQAGGGKNLLQRFIVGKKNFRNYLEKNLYGNFRKFQAIPKNNFPEKKT